MGANLLNVILDLIGNVILDVISIIHALVITGITIYILFKLVIFIFTSILYFATSIFSGEVQEVHIVQCKWCNKTLDPNSGIKDWYSGAIFCKDCYRDFRSDEIPVHGSGGGRLGR